MREGKKVAGESWRGGFVRNAHAKMTSGKGVMLLNQKNSIFGNIKEFKILSARGDCSKTLNRSPCLGALNL